MSAAAAERVIAMVLLGLTAVVIAGGVLSWVLGASLLVLCLLGGLALLLILLALALLFNVERLERRIMDRIDQ